MNTSKIIKAYIGAGTYSTTEPITQGDYGYILQIEGTVLPATYRVDFANDRHEGEALTVYGNEDGAEVPEELIATGKDIFAFYYYIEENFGKTAYTWKIPNDTRAKYGDRTPTPTQQDSIDQLIVRSNEAVEIAERKAEESSESAQSASDSAIEASRSESRAQTHALNAERSSTNADLSANDASESAEAAARSANQAAQIKADVEVLKRDAEAAANASGISARASGEFASQAQGFARQAEGYANGASGYASQASEFAQTASTKASEASQSATTASDKAIESAQSASQALTYKNDAESAKTASQTAQGLAEDARDDTQQAQAMAENAEANAELTVHGVLDSLSLVETSGSIIETHDAFPVSPEKMVVDINPVQDISSGDPSPENICPISGWAEVHPNISGINVWDEEWESGDINVTTGEPRDNASRIRSKNFIPVRPNTVFYGKSSYPNTVVCFYGKDKEWVTPSGYAVAIDRTFITPSWCYWIKLYCNTTAYAHDISINYPSTDHDYHPYAGRSITIDLGQTVYGGHLDVVSGELVITHKGVDMGSLSWSMQAGTGTQFSRFLTSGIASDVSREQTQAGYTVMLDLKAPILIPHENPVYSRNKDNTMCVACATGVFYAICTAYTSAADFKTAVSGMMLVYRLAEPITVQLTPTQITLLKDYNALWADTGDISEFAYRAGEFATKADIPEVPVQDVQVNGESIVQNGIANIDLTDLENTVESLEEDRYKPYVTDTANGSIVSFSDGADNLPLKSFVVSIESKQDGAGDPSLDNVRPISGWTGANVTHFGKNCISNGADRKTITTSLYVKYTPVVSLEDATSVTVSVSADVPSGQTLKLFGYDGQNNSLVGTLTLQGNGRYAITSNGNVIKKTKEFRIYSQPYTGGSSVVTTVWDCTCIINETRTDYIPYQGQSIPISWQTEAGTVYGGSLDVLSGVMRVTNYSCTPDNATRIVYGIDSQSNLPYAFFTFARRAISTSLMERTLCSIYKAVATQRVDKSLRMRTSEADIWDSDLDVTSLDAVKAYFADLVIVYPLETPIEIQLTPHEVNSLLGQNNIFVDTGDVSVEYRADTRLYIEKLTQPEEDDMITDSAITSGQFFMIGNSLYRALANIASGATITVGTNAQRVSLSDALNIVNA